MKKLLFLGLLFFSVGTFAQAVDGHAGHVNDIRVIHWDSNRACIAVGGRWYKLDMASENGRASYSMAMTAFSLGKQLRVKWYADRPLSGGCDTGSNIPELYSVEFE